MMHIIGMKHTQMRADRDKYIKVLKKNVQSFYRREYDVNPKFWYDLLNSPFYQICTECNDHGVPYDCSSIMHYGAETFSTGQWTMKPKSEVGSVPGIL